MMHSCVFGVADDVLVWLFQARTRLIAQCGCFQSFRLLVADMSLDHSLTCSKWDMERTCNLQESGHIVAFSAMDLTLSRLS